MLVAYQSHSQRVYSKQTIVNAIEMYVCGKSIHSISIITGASYNQVNRWISEFYFGYRGDNKILIKLESKI